MSDARYSKRFAGKSACRRVIQAGALRPVRASLPALAGLALMAGSAADAAIIVDPLSAGEPHATVPTSDPETRAPVSSEATSARFGTGDDVSDIGSDRFQELPEGSIWLTMMLGCLGVGLALHRGDTEASARMRFR